MPLATGVHALSLEQDRGDRTAVFHPVAVETPYGLVLVDVGLPGTTDQLSDRLAAAGLSLGDAAVVVLTHQDGDHAGALAEVVDRTNVLVCAHERTAPYVDGREDPLKGDGDRYPAVPVDVELVGGVSFRTDAGPMRVVETPGHAPGHVSLYFPAERLLLAADALTARDGELAGPSPDFTLDPETAADSVRTLASLDVAETLCFHGGHVEAGTDEIAAVAEDLP